MGCINSVSRKDLEENGGVSKFKIGIENQQTGDNLKVSEGVFITTSKENPFDYYENLKQIGEGGIAKVIKVLYKGNNVIRAMKILEWSKVTQTTNITSSDFLTEIQFLKNLDHPNIIKLFEVYDYEGKLYIVSELCTGGDLFEYVNKNGRLKDQEASYIMKQIFSAISFYQSYGIVHSDIKAENILIESKEDLSNNKVTCKLIDFGLSSKIDNESITINTGKEVIGTVSYMAPEAFDGQVSMKSDIWSAGILLFFLLEGKLPFRADTNKELINKIRNCDYEFSTNISFEAKDLLSKLLNKDKNKRVSVKEILQHRFLTKYSVPAAQRSSLSKQRVSAIVGNISRFHISMKLQEIFLGFILRSIADSPRVKELRDLFTDFDINGDGRLSSEELVHCLSQIMGKEEAQEKVEKILAEIDSDKNGYIECSEFIRASIEPKDVINENNLIRVYNIFDKDRSGKISVKEISEVISRDLKLDDKQIEKMIEEVDINGDGELSFSEFKKMILSIFIGRV